MDKIWRGGLLFMAAQTWFCAAATLRAGHAATRDDVTPVASSLSGLLHGTFAGNSSGRGGASEAPARTDAASSTSEELLCMLKRVAMRGEVRAAPHGVLRKRYRDCAVVSNSGTLGGKINGDYVNAAELVFRFNSAPTQGWEMFVGSKDNVRIVNNKYLPRVHGRQTQGGQTGMYLVKDNVAYVVVGPEDEHHDDFAEEFPLAELYRLDPSVSHSLSSILQSLYNSSVLDPDVSHGQSYQPTSGALGMMLALTLCDEVYAFGMASTPNAEISRYHYYDEHIGGTADHNHWHKTFSAEKDLWRRLAMNAHAQIDATEVAYIPGFAQAKCAGVPAGATSISWPQP